MPMPDHNTPKAHKKGKRRRSTLVSARRWIQAFSLCAFMITLMATRLGGMASPANNLAVRISPFTMLTTMISSRTFLIGSSVALVLLASSFVAGRAWCGWLCPLGTILDIFPLARIRKKQAHISDRLRSAKYAILLTAILAAVFSNLTLLFLDPITITTRTLTVGLLPVLDKSIYQLELILVNVPPLADTVYKFDQWLRPAVFQSTPAIFLYPAIVLGFFALLIALNFLAERFWCRYLCPLGAVLGLGAKLSLFRRTVKNSCTSCGLCEATCPTGTIDRAHGFRSDPSECTLCFNCLGTCKNSEFAFRQAARPETGYEYDPGRRTFLESFGAFAVGAVIVNSNVLKLPDTRFALRPPGSTEVGLLSKCVRCGLCVKACPTQALQFDPENSSVVGFMTPVFVPRNGFCDYNCNACGQTCPVQAIPSLLLDEKHKVVIGKAVIDHDICLAWGHQTPCIVCEEMCPLDKKAINLETRTILDPQGQKIELQLPVVNSETCIGCGTCEFKCPVPGEAAIRVHTVETTL